MKRIELLVLFCAVVGSMWAIPARKGGVTVTQPDGSQITVYQNGDEHFHWTTNEKGEWLKMDEDGFYQRTKALSAEEITAKRMAAPSRVAQAAHVATPLNIAPRGVVILVNFQDVTFQTSHAEMEAMHNAKDYTRDYSYKYKNNTYYVQSEGSVREYFIAASNGQYQPQFDVVGPVTVSQNMAYYGANYGDFDKAPWDMVKEACQLVDDSVDFTQYDNDNDGYVDFVYVVYAGYGEADGGAANTIWPHSYWLMEAGVNCTVDGKRVNLYACGNEMDYYTKHHTGIGTFCHEFSHVLGLPDLYTTDGSSHRTCADWDIMDYGPYNNDGNTPPSYSAYERFFMGWLTPRVLVDAENVKLEELNESNTALLISETDVHNLKGNDPSPSTFYMLENRQQKGWDSYLPGHGMMLTKIKYSYNKWYQNTVNNSAKSLGVDIIEADGLAGDSESQYYWGKPGDLFPEGDTEYTAIAGHEITNITEVDGVIYFQYKGGVESAVEDITAGEAIIAIYNLLGQKEATTEIGDLGKGTYILKTAKGSYKIIR